MKILIYLLTFFPYILIAQNNENEENEDDIKSYSELIDDTFLTEVGLFNVHQNGKIFYYEIPKNLLNKEMLMVTRIAKTANGIG